MMQIPLDPRQAVLDKFMRPNPPVIRPPKDKT